LAVEFSVSARTIKTDIKTLMVSGYPIQADAGRGGGIRYFGHNQKFQFTDRQRLAIHNAIAIASPKDKPILQDLLRDNSPLNATVTNGDIFDLLKDGISQAELARKLGVSQTLITLVLSGKRNMSEELSYRISKFRKEILSKNAGN